MDIQPLGSVTQSGFTTTPASGSVTATPATGVPVAATTVASAPAAPASAPATPAVAAVQPEPPASQVSQAVQKINTAMAAQSQGIEFSIDSTSHRIVVNIVDQKTNQIIRQIPSKEALAIADSLDQTQGLLIKQQA